MNKYIKIKVRDLSGGSGNPKLNFGNPKLNLGNLASSNDKSDMGALVTEAYNQAEIIEQEQENPEFNNDDIYIELWNSIDKPKFDPNNDNLVTEEEYNKMIHSYFDFATLNYPSELLDYDRYQNEIDTLFKNSDTNNDSKLDTKEQYNLAKSLRSQDLLKIHNLNNLPDETYSGLIKILGMEHICPNKNVEVKDYYGNEPHKVSDDRNFGFQYRSPDLDKQVSRKDTEKIISMFKRMRYLVEVKKKLVYITLDNRTTYEEEIFNLVCNDTTKCKFHKFIVPDFGIPKVNDLFEILKILSKIDEEKDVSIVIHCGAGYGRTGLLFMLYIWYKDYIDNNDNCVEYSNKLIDFFNKLNKSTLQFFSSKHENILNVLLELNIGYKIITDLFQINYFSKEIMDDADELIQNFNFKFNDYLESLKQKLHDNYHIRASEEIFDDNFPLLAMRLYTCVTAIKKFVTYKENLNAKDIGKKYFSKSANTIGVERNEGSLINKIY